MRTNDSKTSVDSKLEEMEEKYPVEQIAVKNEKKITAKDVKEAVKEINPIRTAWVAEGKTIF